MSTSCIVCADKMLKYSSLYSLHAFPTCPKRRQTWLNQCGLSDKEVLPNHKICSFHFEPKYFKSGVTRRILYRTAVPTIFGDGHVKTETLPLKNVKGRPKNRTKNEIVVQNCKSRDIPLEETAKRVDNSQNCASPVVTPRVAINEDFDRISSNLESQLAEFNQLEGRLVELNKEKSSLESLLRLIIKDHNALNDLLN